MASNILPSGLQDLFTLAEDMADGLHAHEAAIGIKQNTELVFRTDLTAAITAQANHVAAQTAKVALSTAVTVADSNGKPSSAPPATSSPPTSATVTARRGTPPAFPTNPPPFPARRPNGRSCCNPCKIILPPIPRRKIRR